MKISRFQNPRPDVIALLALVMMLGAAACSVNPATGKRQLSLIGEGQEIEIGREADQQVIASMGLYPDEGLQRYVDELGQRLAAASERPDLPWTFRVIDDQLFVGEPGMVLRLVRPQVPDHFGVGHRSALISDRFPLPARDRPNA